ncbi:hypothetical protein LP419_36990 [Massilia sp. H-1]|nr:hypothetical protein LP419_36990 [Massilia sp. H-1]
MPVRRWNGRACLSTGSAFFPTTLRAVHADHQCVRRTGGVCLLGETILWGSQDPAAFDLEVEPVGMQTVGVCYKDLAGVRSCMTVKGASERGRPRIRDIVYADGHSLRAALRLKP